MSTKLLPLYFNEANEREHKEFNKQLDNLRLIYQKDTEFLDPRPVHDFDSTIADAIIFPQLIGAIFENKRYLADIKLPIIIITSQFGTVEMWDWEIVAYLREELKLQVFTPYNVEMGMVILRSISARKQMHSGINFLMMQDSPGEGMQSNIFKRFYWWEKECAQQIERAFGIHIIYRSWKEVNENVKGISDETALLLWNERKVPCEGVPIENILKAVKLYIAIHDLAESIGNIQGIGSNCLNESFHSETTPCLAWNWMFEYDHIIWACEGDLVTLISKYILYSGLQKPIMMTNIYPFLVGMAALKHEKINEFPDIKDPDNHALGVHCGYFGFAPQSFCSEWTMRPKVLEIVNDNAIVIDCRFATGPVTMAKLHADMKKLTIIEAEIEDYVQYPGSDCRNGSLIRYKNNNGHKVMESLSSHHAIIIQGNVTPQLLQLAKIYHFDVTLI
ncbi:MAG: hypothetical protein K0R92_2679 [Lachnospiraceae bacterium]|jgi:hypothetical protein|nr:hypothetical protein [Lachnospiraceae bacterium]